MTGPAFQQHMTVAVGTIDATAQVFAPEIRRGVVRLPHHRTRSRSYTIYETDLPGGGVLRDIIDEERGVGTLFVSDGDNDLPS